MLLTTLVQTLLSEPWENGLRTRVLTIRRGAKADHHRVAVSRGMRGYDGN